MNTKNDIEEINYNKEKLYEYLRCIYIDEYQEQSDNLSKTKKRYKEIYSALVDIKKQKKIYEENFKPYTVEQVETKKYLFGLIQKNEKTDKPINTVYDSEAYQMLMKQSDDIFDDLWYLEEEKRQIKYILSKLKHAYFKEKMNELMPPIYHEKQYIKKFCQQIKRDN